MSTRQAGVWVALLAALTILVPTPALHAIQGEEPSLDIVLARAADYVTDFRPRLSGIVAEERYEQRATTPPTTSFRSYTVQYRELRSDFLLVRPEGEDRYFEFRDVFEVDGSPVRDREERLTRLFLDNSTSAARQIRRIGSESARYNIGDVERTLNTPTLALVFLLPSYQPQMSFSRVTDTSPQLAGEWGGPADSSDLWVVGYEEVPPNTLVRGRGGKDLPAEGRFWIEPTAGGVLVSEIVIEDPEVRASVDVRYESDPAVGHLVPVEMRERYENRRNGTRVEGTATYSRFRRFQVHVQETAPTRN